MALNKYMGLQTQECAISPEKAQQQCLPQLSRAAVAQRAHKGQAMGWTHTGSLCAGAQALPNPETTAISAAGVGGVGQNE